MRIACVHLPAFPLQVEVRLRPELAGSPVVVLSAPPRPRVAFCSRAAHDRGVRAGLPTLAARALAPELVALEPVAARWREALADLAGELVDLSPAVEAISADDSWSILLEVPAGRRSAEVARALLAIAEAAGYRARVGIAPDRFTAHAAARFGERVTLVRRGQAAAFLAPLSIDLLPLQPEVRAMLCAAGVRTLGQFAALPPPSVDRPCAIDYRELARGNGPSQLTPFRPLRSRRRTGLGQRGDGRQLPLVSAPAW